MQIKAWLRLFRPGRLTKATLLMACAIVSCQLAQPDTSNLVTPERTERIPAYIGFTAPKPQEIVLSQTYETGGHYPPTGNPPPRKPESSICVEVILTEFLKPGRHFSARPGEGLYLPEHVSLFVDEQRIPMQGDVATVGALTQLVDEQGNVESSAPGPQIICWRKELEVGRHEARIEIELERNEVESYNWGFKISAD